MEKNDLLNILEKFNRKEFLTEQEFLNCLEIIEKINKFDLTKDEEKYLIISGCDINILYLKFLIKNTPENDYENLLHYRGKLIKFYKNKEKLCMEQGKKYEIRKIYLEELKKHRDVLSIYRNDRKKIFPITKKVALTIKDIAKSMEIFMKEKDILKKVKQIVKDTAGGVTGVALISIVIAVAVMCVTQVPITTGNLLSFIVNCSPAAAYIGLSSLIRNLNNKTEFQQYLFKTSTVYQNLIKTFQIDNKDAIDNITRMKQNAALLGGQEKINLNDEIISKINVLINKTDVMEIKEGFELDILSLLRENKDIREKIKDEYLEGINKDTELYKQNNNELKKLNIELFKKENSIKEAFKYSGVNLATSIPVILMSKAILAAIAPGSFEINGIGSLSTPILISMINGLLDIPTYHKKRKLSDTEYDERKDREEMEQIAQILNIEKTGMKLA